MAIFSDTFSDTIIKMIKYDAKKAAIEWIDSVGAEDALVMVFLTHEADLEGRFRSEPAEYARDQLYKYLSDGEVEFAWPLMLNEIERQIKMYINNNQ